MKTVRAMWVVRDVLGSQERIGKLVATARQAGFTDLIVQVRGRGETYYRSSIDPMASELSGNWDPLQRVIEQAQPAGIRIHAWVNACLTWSRPQLPPQEDHVIRRHPEWVMMDGKGKSLLEYSPEDIKADGQLEGINLCPSHEEVVEYLASIYVELAEKYQVDGLHFDYIRYPNPRFCYCPSCRETFAARYGKQLQPEALTAGNAQADDYRRWTVTRIVETVRSRLNQVAPDKVLSAAVFADKNDAYNNRFQDWGDWVGRNLLDMLVPMSYSPDTDRVLMQTRVAKQAAGDIPVVAGVGIYQQPPELAAEKIVRVSEYGAAGYCLFSYNTLEEDPSYLKSLF